MPLNVTTGRALYALRSGVLTRIDAGATPADPIVAIPGLVARWRADQITGLTGGAVVASWPDMSANGYTATEATARPTWQAAALGGQPVVRFAGAQQLLASAPSGDPQQTVVAVVSAGGSGVRTLRGAGGSRGLQFRLESGGAIGLVSQASANIAASTTTVTNAVPAIVTATFDQVANTYAFYHNGAASGSGAATQDLLAQTTVIGQRAGGLVEYLTGDLAELLVWSRVLTSTELSTVHSYASARYGVTLG